MVKVIPFLDLITPLSRIFLRIAGSIAEYNAVVRNSTKNVLAKEKSASINGPTDSPD